MTDLATIAPPADLLVRIDQLQPLDEIAGPDQPNGPWLVVAVFPTSDFDRVVLLDEAGTEHEVTCRPGQLVKLAPGLTGCVTHDQLVGGRCRPDLGPGSP